MSQVVAKHRKQVKRAVTIFILGENPPEVCPTCETVNTCREATKDDAEEYLL
jgi:hypothetical protein